MWIDSLFTQTHGRTESSHIHTHPCNRTGLDLREVAMNNAAGGRGGGRGGRGGQAGYARKRLRRLEAGYQERLQGLKATTAEVRVLHVGRCVAVG